VSWILSISAVEAQQLEEIVVTAQKRTETTQDVAATISVVDSKQLDTLRVERPLDLANAVPGLSTYNATSGGTPLFAIRGIGMDDFDPNNTSGVGTYVDDVYESFPAFLNGQIFDVERVEVLEGPQGTLYGKNATGGAINFISRKPTDETTGYFDVSYGRWNSVDVKAAVGGQLTDTLTGRIAGTWTGQGEGYQTDIETGNRYGKPNRGALRGQLEFKPTTDFTALLNVHLSQDESVPPVPQTYGNEALLPPAAKGLIDTPSSDPSVVRVGNSISPKLNEHGAGLSLALTYDAGEFLLNSTTGYDHFDYRTVDDNSGTDGPTYWFYQDDLMNQFYEELRATSKQGLFGGLTDWVVGASYSKDTIHGMDSSDQSAPFVGEYLDPPNFFEPGLNTVQANYIQSRTSFGFFVHTETHLTDKLSYVLGGRYSHDQLDFNGATTEGGQDPTVIPVIYGNVVTALDQVHNEQNFSYQTGLNYKLFPKVLLYGTISTAYKAGAYYASPALDPAAWGYVSPEHITAFELGEKSTLLDDRLQLNGSYFHYNYTDRQSLVDFVSPSTGAFVDSLANIPKSEIDGVEVEGSVTPLDGWQLSGSATYLDARVTESLLNVRGAPLLLAVPDGTPLSMSPKWTFLARTSYQRPITDKLQAGGELDYSWRDDQSSQLGDPNAVSGVQKLLGASLWVGQIAKGLTVSLWGRNLTNANFSTYQFTSFYGGTTMYREMPRTYGIEVRDEF
jgi:iron complex outermembrane recepter protein